MLKTHTGRPIVFGIPRFYSTHPPISTRAQTPAATM